MLNRAASVGEFVKIGEENASIEVELYHPEEGNIIIVREFNKAGKSNWKLNGKKSGVREVERKAAELRIQVDNLCQFLPQDRIHEFSTLNNKGLLESTVDAVGDTDLKEKHAELKQLQKTMSEGQDLFERKRQMLAEKTEECRRLEEDVKAFEEKKEVEAKVEVARGKLVWSRFEEARKFAKTIDIKFKKAEENYKNERSRLTPIESSVEKFGKKKESIMKKKQDLSASSKDLTNKAQVHWRNINDSEEKIRDVVDQLENQERVEEEKKKEIQRLKTSIAELEQEFSSIEDDASLAPELERAKSQTSHIQRQLEEVQGESDGLKYEEQTLTREHKYHSEQLLKVDNIDKLKLIKLKSVGGEDSLKAVNWLRQNRGEFQAGVYEPFIISANVNNPAESKFVENIIQRRDLTAFLFEDAEDMNKFLGITRDQLNMKKVAAVQVPRESLQQFRPQIDGRDLKKFGFLSYLVDLVTGPDQVLAYMCRMYGLHRIPVFSEDGDRHHDKLLDLGFTKFFVGNKIHSVSVSRYSKAKSTLTREVLPRKWLEISKDSAKEEQLTAKIRDIERKIGELTRKASSYREKIQTIQVKLEDARKYQNDLEKRRHYKATRGAKIESQKKVLRSKLAEDNSNRGRTALESKMKDLLSQQVVSCKQHRAIISDLNQMKLNMEVCKISLLPLDEIIEKKQLELNQGEQSLGGLEENMRELRDELKESTESAKAALRDATDVTGRNSKKVDEPPVAVKKDWEEKEIPNGAEQIETLIHELQAKADCMDTIDKRIVKEYRNLKDIIKELENDIATRDAEMDEHGEKMNDLKASWLESLEELVERINTNFADFFTRMGFAGEVGLKRGNHENDFENYGISIRVKFRDDEPLQELTGARQSGGERSVSTALYMLALQQLTSVPFR